MVVNFWRYATVALLALVAFAASLNNELLYDDMRVAKALGSVSGATDFDNWARQDAPLRQMSVFADARCFGQDLLSFHGENLLWHALGSVVLLALFRRLFDKKEKESDIWFLSDVSWWAAAAFAIWPAAAATVAVFAHRNEMIGLLLMLLALFAWLRPERSLIHWILGGCFAVLATLETRMVLLLPAIVFAYDLCLSPKSTERRWQTALVSAGFIAIGLIAAQTGWRYWIEGYGNTSMESWELAPAWESWPLRLLRYWAVGVLTGLHWLVVPEFFNADHGLTNSLVFEAAGGWCVVGVCVAFIVWLAQRQPVLCFAMVWLFAGLGATALNVVRHDYGALLEQELYVVIPALALVVGMGAAAAISSCASEKWRWIRLGLLGAVLAALALWSNGRAGEFKSEMTVQMKTLDAQPSSGLAHLSLGRLLLNGGLTRLAEKQFVLAARANWNYFETYGNLGETAYFRKDFIVSEKCFREALSYNPKSFLARYHLGHALLGQKKYAQAREVYQKLLEERPRFIPLYEALAATYDGENRVYEARRAIEQAKKLIEEARKRQRSNAEKE